ncbi:MAG TPA: exonuclease [Candidatus Binatia bacterium]|nr:exonuclease [Candidatus Binatia bacterium]
MDAPHPPRAEVYVSTDVEADGPIPGRHSMISLASAAFRTDGVLIGTWSANLLPLEGAAPDPETELWWAEHPDALAATAAGRRPPEEAMAEYASWVEGLPGAPVFVAYPVGFDFTFVYWYLVRFTGRSVFGQSGLDMRSFAMAVLRRKYRHSGKQAWPSRWRSPELPHTHVALDDALEQGRQFCAMLAEMRDAPRLQGARRHSLEPGEP